MPSVGTIVKVAVAAGVAVLMGASTYKKTGDAVDTVTTMVKTAKKAKEVTE